MQAEPIYADIYVRFREKNYGRTKVPGLEVFHDDKWRVYPSVDTALNRIRKLHDDNLKGTLE